MMYTYYQEVESDKHFYFSSEICDYFGVYTITSKPHMKFFTAFYDSYRKNDEKKLYYRTAKGLARVYPNADIIKKFVDFIMKKIEGTPENVQSMEIAIRHNDKCYNVKIQVEQFTKAYNNFKGGAQSCKMIQ